MLPSPSSQKQSQIASFEIRSDVVSLAFAAACEVQLIILIFTNAESEVLGGLVIYSEPQSWEVKLGFKFSQTDFQEASFALFMLWVNQFFSNGEETFILSFQVVYRNRPRCGLLSSEISNH